MKFVRVMAVAEDGITILPALYVSVSILSLAVLMGEQPQVDRHILLQRQRLAVDIQTEAHSHAVLILVLPITPI